MSVALFIALLAAAFVLDFTAFCLRERARERAARRALIEHRIAQLIRERGPR